MKDWLEVTDDELLAQTPQMYLMVSKVKDIEKAKEQAKKVQYDWPFSTKYPWQLELEYMLQTEPDDRSIIIITDYVGNSGKTQWCKWMGRAEGCQYLRPDCKRALTFLVEE